MFAAAAHKLLSTDDQTMTIGGFGISPRRAAQISAEHDVVVLPTANALRLCYHRQLTHLADLVER